MQTLFNAKGLPRGRLPLDQRGFASGVSISMDFYDEVAAAACCANADGADKSRIMV